MPLGKYIQLVSKINELYNGSLVVWIYLCILSFLLCAIFVILHLFLLILVTITFNLHDRILLLCNLVESYVI
jgi:hypothetical protein